MKIRFRTHCLYVVEIIRKIEIITWPGFETWSSGVAHQDAEEGTFVEILV